MIMFNPRRLYDEWPTVDDLNPALPRIRNIPEIPHSLRSLRQCRINIINSSGPRASSTALGLWCFFKSFINLKP